MRQGGWNQSVTHFRNVLKGAFEARTQKKPAVWGRFRKSSEIFDVMLVSDFYRLLTLLCNFGGVRWTKITLSTLKPAKILCALARLVELPARQFWIQND